MFKVIIMQDNQYIAVSKIGEVISDSSLAYGYALPKDDPRLIEIITAQADQHFLQLMKESAIYTRFKMDNFIQKQKDNTLAEKIINFINDRAFQFNSRERFYNCEIWHEAIKKDIAKNKPIDIVIPIFCNIGNPLKRFQTTQVSAAEKVTLFSLYGISELASKIYPPGIKFHIVVDSNFYSTPFGVNTVEINNYLKQIKDFVFINNLSDRLDVADITELLSPVSEAFSKNYTKWLDYFSSNAPEDNITYEEYLQIYTEQNNKIKEFVDDLSKKSLDIYCSLKYAAADLCWENLQFEGSVRSTIHTKILPVLGLRIYPEYKLRSRLLPYHGIAIFYRDLKSKSYKMEVIPEAIACTKSNIKRIVDGGMTQGYVIDDGLN